MAINRVTLNTEQMWVQAIHRLAKSASTCRVAVAYCGREAYKFFPETPADRPEDLRIMVDASKPSVRRGLTNPEGIRHLLGLTGEIRSLTALHAKVFIFDDRAALVGSTNMSRASISQFQLGLEISDLAVIRQMIAWFDRHWKDAQEVNVKMIRELNRIWPVNSGVPIRQTHAELPPWRGEAPQPPLGASEFKVARTNQELKQLISEFRSNRCAYSEDGDSCFDTALRSERRYRALGNRLRSLWHRRASWGKNDLEQLFDIAYTNGRAARMRKPEFTRQNPKKVARSIHFLFEGSGDPYIRFEKMLVSGSRYKLSGMGEVGLICLMHLWDPRKFALIAGPVDNALKMLVNFPQPISLRKGQGFKDRTAAVREIAKRTGLETFGRVDHFLDAIGKRHIGNLRASR
jgi:hypothetical protein